MSTYRCVCGRAFPTRHLLHSHISRVQGGPFPDHSHSSDSPPPFVSDDVSASAHMSDGAQPMRSNTDPRPASSNCILTERYPNVADSVRSFYNSFHQHTEAIFQNLPALWAPIASLPLPIRSLIMYCADICPSAADIRGLYIAVVAYDDHPQKQALYPTLQQFFRKPSLFVTYITIYRKRECVSRGWRSCILHFPGGVLNDTGVYRCPFGLLLSLPDANDGVAGIAPFRESIEQSGRRVFQSPLDTNGFKDYSTAAHPGTQIVLLDVFADGLNLPTATTQSVTPICVRGQCHIWHEVGLAPVSTIADMDIPSGKRREGRFETFQRFLYELFRNTISASFVGANYKRVLLLPRVNIVSCDERQERDIYCLKMAVVYGHVHFAMPLSNRAPTSRGMHYWKRTRWTGRTRF